jgi:hypothetical protein
MGMANAVEKASSGRASPSEVSSGLLMEDGEGDDGQGEGNGGDHIDLENGEAMKAGEDFGECGTDDALDERFTQEAEGERGDGDAELAGGEVGVQAGDDPFGCLRAAGFILGGGFHLAGPDLDDGELGRHEKGVEQQEQDDTAEVEENLPAGRKFGGGGGENGGKHAHRSEFLVLPLAAAFEDREPGLFGVTHRERFGDGGGVDPGNEFFHRVLAQRADLQRGPVNGPPQFETAGTDTARSAGIFRSC